jgi:hypothetical protein
MKGWISYLSVLIVTGALLNAEELPLDRDPTLSPAGLSATNQPTSPLVEAGKVGLGLIQAATRAELLTELADDHEKRSEALKLSDPKKSQWERQLAAELRDKIPAQTNRLATTLLSIGSPPRPQVEPPPTQPAGDSASATNTPSEQEQAYLSFLEERLARIRQDLAAVNAAAAGFTASLQTNNTPEDVGQASILIQLNNRDARELEREQADLLLRRLDFQARSRN